MADLAARLLAAIEETERVARAACTPIPSKGVWVVDRPIDAEIIDDAFDYRVVVYDEGAPSPGQAAHIVHNDPHAVLRRCAADRKILHEHSDNGGWIRADDGSLARSGPVGARCATCWNEDLGAPLGSEFAEHAKHPCKTLLALAEGYGLAEEAAHV